MAKKGRYVRASPGWGGEILELVLILAYGGAGLRCGWDCRKAPAKLAEAANRGQAAGL